MPRAVPPAPSVPTAPTERPHARVAPDSSRLLAHRRESSDPPSVPTRPPAQRVRRRRRRRPVQGVDVGPYCTLCNVTDGSRYYDSDTSSCPRHRQATGGAVALVIAVLAGALLLVGCWQASGSAAPATTGGSSTCTAA